MKSIQFTVQVSDSGLIQLNLPPEFAGQKIELTLQIYKVKNSPQNWQTFINQTYGCLADEPLTRPEQLPLQIRQELL